MNQIEAAQKAGITQGFLSLILNGKRQMPWRIAKKLAEITGTEPAFWFEATEDAKREALRDA